MSNHTITHDPNTNSATIVVHARGSLTLPFARQDSLGASVDISGLVLRFECDEVPITELLVADPNNAEGQMIVLGRTQIALIAGKNKGCAFAVIDETTLTSDDTPIVIWKGTIRCDGFIGAPDTVEG